MSNIIDSIQLSGTTYQIQGSGGGGNPTVEVTQAEYDAMVTAGTVSADTYYIITDAQVGDLTNYYTKSETNTLLGGKADTATTYTKTEVDTLLGGKANTATTYTKTEVDNAITAATSTKQDTLVSGTNIKTINNTSILGSGNIDIQGGGGGKAVSGGTNISITTGETADTINCTLPISADTGGIYTTSSYPFTSSASRSYNAVFGNSNVIDVFGNSRRSDFNALFGNNNGVRADGGNSSSHFIAGSYNNVRGTNNYRNALFGYYNNSQNNSEFGCGQYNVSTKAFTTFGDSGNTLFSVGNGTADNARHNAFEIRQNGDIYLTKDGQDVKLQDQLGGSSITVDTALDSGSTNPVENRVIYNKIDEVEQVTAAALNNINDRLSEDEEVTAAGLNAVNDKFGGLKLVSLTQAEYNALATKDASTLYIIVN